MHNATLILALLITGCSPDFDLASYGRESACLCAPAAATVSVSRSASGMIIDMTTAGAVGDGVTDNWLTIQQALDSVPNGPNAYCPSKASGGAGRVTLLFGTGEYRVSQALDCSQRDYVQIVGRGRVSINSESPSYIIDMSSADHCQMTGIRLASNTATVGIYIDRCASNPFAMFNEFHGLSITMETSATANYGQGTIGVYNGRGEQNLFSNLEIRADVPLWERASCDSARAPLFGAQNTSIVSGTVCSFIQCNFIANGPQSYPMILQGVIGHEFRNCYWAQAGINTGSVHTAIYADSVHRCMFTGSVESLARFMRVVGCLYSCSADIIMQSGFGDSGGIFNMDAPGENGFINGSVSVMNVGTVPGSCVFKDSGIASSVIIRGNAIKHTSTMSAISTTGMRSVANNTTQSDWP